MKYSVDKAVELIAKNGLFLSLDIDLVASQVGRDNRAFEDSLNLCSRHTKCCPKCGEPINTRDLHCPSCKADFMWFEKSVSLCSLCAYEWDDHS